MLKTRLDEGRDHLGLFEPFVEDTVVHLPGDDFAAADLRTAIEARHSLLIPLETVHTLLGRLGKRDAVRKEGGRYFRLPFTPATDIVAQTAILNEELLRFGEALVAFSLSTKHPMRSAEDALALLIGFIQENNIALLLSELEGESAPSSGAHRAHYRVVAKFITTECGRDDELRRTLERVVEGLVLKNALLLDDLAASAQRFDSLEVFLDSYIAFAAIGLTGISESIAVAETLSLLKETGAVPAVFDVTIAEMRRLLAMLEDHLGTAEGRMSLRPTAITRHVLTSNLKPSDMRIISASLEARMRELGIAVKDTPPRDRRFTLDEDQLSQDLADWTGDTQRHRVRHDVDCAAGVLTLRAGRRPRRLESGRAIFASTSPRVIRNVTAWHRSQGETGIPPIIDIRALANIAWLKRPASARSLKVHQLVALCSAALRPTRETWDKFIGNLKSLRQQGALSDEHTLALVASELVEPILSELEDDREPDAASIHEAIERVKAAYRDEGRATVQQALQLAESEAHLAQQTASAALARQASIDSHLADRAHRIGRVSANTAVAVVVILLLASIVIGFPGAFERIPSAFRFIAWGSIATAALFTAWGYWSGFSVRDLRHAIERAVSTRVLRYLRPPDTPLNGQGHR